jgi:3-phenylpropionate/cinnamic acid dioxygenase small subunit
MSEDAIVAGGPLPVQDHVEIQNLYARYNHTIDASEYDAWTACFTPDGEFVVEAVRTTYRGPVELASFADRYMSRTGGRERHVASNVELEATGPDTVRGRAYLLMVMSGGPKNPPSLVSFARYEDVVTRTAVGWRFARRTIRYDPA